MAAKKFGIPAKGTHAHAFVSSFHSNEASKDVSLLNKNDNTNKNLLDTVMIKLKEISKVFKFNIDQTNQGELKAFTAYANAFPSTFLALIDTYNVLK